jgi:nucleotide-binding universal stress UspA family protein
MSVIGMKPIRHVLCATDLLTTSRHTFETAIVLAKSANATLTILHVLAPPVVVPEQYLDALTLDRLQKRIRAWALKELQKLSVRANRANVETSVLLRNGEPAEEIVRTGRATKADLIVTGTHGRRGLQRLFLGSVAQRVAASASCPVVTVRGK